MLKIDVLTLFPKMFENVLGESILKRAQDKGKLKVRIHNLRDWTRDSHRSADDKPFGGGPGMVMKVEPVYLALAELGVSSFVPFGEAPLRSALVRPLRGGSASLRTRSSFVKKRNTEYEKRNTKRRERVILLTPQGKKLDQSIVKKLSKEKRLVLICGHYEGIDERIRNFVDEEISIGDYVLTCGELPALVLIDSVTRLIPGVLGDSDSSRFESFEKGLLEYPQYTRPSDFRGMKVPRILLSGDRKRIDGWRMAEAMKRTLERRPDLFENEKRSKIKNKI